MTDAEILAAIDADPAAKALADAGNDEGCAARLRATLPRVRTSPRISIAELQRVVFEPDLIGPIRAAAAANNTAAMDAMALFSARFDTVDATAETFVAKITALIQAGLISAQDVSAIQQIGLTTPNITANDVSRVMLPARPGGVVPHVN